MRVNPIIPNAIALSRSANVGDHVRAVGSCAELEISALRVDVKPRAPDSNEAVLFKEAFSDRVVWKVRSVGEADGPEDYVERVLFIWEQMLDSKPKLTRRCIGLGLDVLWMRLVKASWTVAFDVKGEALSDVRRFSHVEGWIDKLFRPPISVFNVDRTPAWPFENYVSVRTYESSSWTDPPEGINAGAFRQFDGPPDENMINAENGRGRVHLD